MTSAETIPSDPPQPSVALCAILSVVVHVGLLAVLGFIPEQISTNESNPIMQISLVPVQSEKPSVSPAQPAPSLRAVSRPVSAPLSSSPPAPQVMTSRMKSVDSTLEPPVAKPAQEPPPPSAKKKIVTDQQATDALVGRTLMKLSNSRSTPSQAHSSQTSSPTSQLMISSLKSVDSTLEPPVTQSAQEPPPTSAKKKVVKDQQAADALVGRTLMKMSASRRTPSQEHSSSPASQVMTPGPKTLNPTLKSSVNQATHKSSRNSKGNRVVKDQQATDALVGRTLMKMGTPRSAPSRGHSLGQPSHPALSGPNNATTPSSLVDSSANSKEGQPISSVSGQRRVLAAIPPGGQEIAGSQVEILHYVPPVHPRLAKELGWEGTVVLKFLVKTNGLPTEVTVNKSSGYPILDKAATDAIRQWRFKPAMDGNIPINKIAFATLKFTLNK